MSNCKRVIINTNNIDEFNNIYPCKTIECDKYHKSLDSHALIDALYFLKLNRVIDILDNMTYDKIISFRTYDKKNNILEYIFSEFKGKNTKMPTIGRLSNNNQPICYESIELTKTIIYYIMNKYPELITEKVSNKLKTFSGLITLEKINSTF
jgi:hypothetical protein